MPGRRGVWLFAATSLLAGCTAPSRPVTIAQALQTLQSQLRAAGAINAGVASPAAFAQAVLEAQCEAGSADPEVPVLAHDITVDLTGSFTANGGFAVGPSITGGPPFGLSGSVTRGQTQGLTLPITFAALSAVPDVVAAQRVPLFAGLPAKAKAAEMRSVLAERDRLRLRVRAAIARFRPGLCASLGTPGPGLHGGPWQPMIAHPAAR